MSNLKKITLIVVELVIIAAVFYFGYNFYLDNSGQYKLLNISSYTSDEFSRDIATGMENIKSKYDVEILVADEDYDGDNITFKKVDLSNSNEVSDLIKQVEACLSNMPKELFETYENGIQFIYVNELALNNIDGGAIAVGYTVQNKGKDRAEIYISSSNNTYSLEGATYEQTVYHELFHLLDNVFEFDKDVYKELNPQCFEYGNVSEAEYLQQANYFVNYYATYSVEEDMCEVFANFSGDSSYFSYTKAITGKWDLIRETLEEQSKDVEFIKFIKSR